MNQMSSPRRQQLGRLGEELATQFLIKSGFRIIARNFKARYGEIDIIAVQNDTLVFVEVKTRTSFLFGYPEEAITPRKLKEVIRTGQLYVSLHNNLPSQLRIDVLAIVLTDAGKVESIKQIPNVTQ